MDDYLRRVFGFPSNHDRFFDSNSRVPGFRNPIWEEEDDDDDLEDFAHGYPRDQPFGFNVFTGDPFQMHLHFEREMNDVMRSFQEMFRGQFGPLGEGLPQLPAPNFGHVEDPRAIAPSPRDRYLKPSYKKSMGQHQGDSDIDNRVTSGNLGEILGDENNGVIIDAPRPHFFGQSVVSKSVRGPDGRVEHHKMFTRSDGTKEETITRQLGDQTYSVTTKTNVDGTVEKNEDFINMDEENLGDFERKWFNGNSRPGILQPKYDNVHTEVVPSNKGSSSHSGGWFKNIFGKWFS